jgi:hypothetical protein
MNTSLPAKCKNDNFRFYCKSILENDISFHVQRKRDTAQFFFCE